MENTCSDAAATQSSDKGVSYNAQNFAITIGNQSNEETQKQNNTNLPSLFSSPLNSLRSFTRRSISKESSHSTSESTSEDAAGENVKKALDNPESHLERRNLLNMIKMSVKNLIESSLAAGHTLDNDNLALQQFFIIFENVLRHRLKGSKGFFNQNKYFWPVLEAVERFHSSAGPITASVRSLPGTKTFLGKARAWVRLALMQKKLAEYFQVFVENKDFFKEWYEGSAVLINEEASVMLGHLIGINCIDANLCIRELDLDNQSTLIDFSLYVKDSEHYTTQNETIDDDSLTQKLLDQKNYLEERNRHLETNLSEALKRLEAHQTTVETQRVDLEALKIQLSSVISGNQKLQAEYNNMKKSHQETLQERDRDLNEERNAWTKSKTELDQMVSELKAQLKQETALRFDVEKELEQEMAQKQELEVVVKLHESDLSHKQQGLVALREQLDDVKMANADLYLKLQARSNDDENENSTVEHLQTKTESLKKQVMKLQEDLEESKRQGDVAREQAGRYSNQLDDSEKTKNVLSTNLQIERDWRQNLQKEEERSKQEVAMLQEKIEMFQNMKEELEKTIQDRDHLQKLFESKEILSTGKQNEVSDEVSIQAESGEG